MDDGVGVAVDASTDVESDAFWNKLVRHTGSFTVQCRDGSMHVVRWDPPPNRHTAGGAIGYYIHEAKCSEGPSIRMDWYRCRIHLCRQAPCTADHSATKYGQLPPPSAHCRVLRLGAPVLLAPTNLAPAAAEEELAIELSELPLGQHPPLPPPAQWPDDDSEDLRSEDLAAASVDMEIAISEAGECIAEVSDDIVAAIIARAEVVGRPRGYTGFFDFVAFSAMRRRRLLLRLPDGVMDMVSAFAPNIVNDTWSVAPFHVQLVACRDQQRAWVMADLSAASHFYAGVPIPAQAVQGSGIVSQCLRLGIAAMATAADGDCALDALCIAEGTTRSLTSRVLLRAEMRTFMISVAGDPRWHSIWRACQEHSVPAAPVESRISASAASAAAPAAPAEAGSSAAAANAGPSAAPADAGKAVKGKSQQSQAVLSGAASSSSLVPVAPAVATVAASSTVAPVVAGRGQYQELLAAVRWGTGLPNPSEAVVRRLACDLSPDEGNKLIAKHKQTVEKAKLGPRTGDGCLEWKDKRVRRDIPLRQKLGDAAVFAQWLAKSSIDYRTSIPFGKVQEFLRLHSEQPLSAKARRQGQQYLSRAMQLYTSGAVETRKQEHCKKITGIRHVRYTKRERRLLYQGRPHKASLVREELWQWFSNVKRSIMSRISPGAVLRKARTLLEVYVAACLREGCRADAPVISYSWLRGWRHEYHVSFRKPNRKWKVPLAVLQERLKTTWLNVIRVRHLAVKTTGSDPVMFNFDQSPFHMNEAGSREQRTLATRGASDIVLKEGHAATRARWTANTMTVPDPSVCSGGLPPLELMFRVEGSGVRVHPRLRSFIPNWAPWLTVVTSDSGSYKEGDVLTYLETVLTAREEGQPWRILLVDVFAAQTTDAVRRLAWQRGYVLCIHGGGATGVCQPNDTDLHGEMKRLYLEMEAADAAEQQRLRPEGVPVARVQDCIAWMAALWSQQWLHQAAAEGFKKVGLSNALNGDDDRLICREALRFWNDLGMNAARTNAMHDVDVELAAGRLDWSYESVCKVLAPFPVRGRRLDRLPSDEGSDIDSEGDSHTESTVDDGDVDDVDDDNGGGGGGAIVDKAPADEGKPVSESAPVETGAAHAILDHSEQALVADCAFRLSTFKSVLEQLKPLSCDSLIVQVQNALHLEERRSRGRAQTNRKVARAMLQEREMELEDYARRNAREAAARNQNDLRMKTIKGMRAEQEALHQRRLDLQRASTVVESLTALKCFEIADLGQGHAAGGTAEHIRNRMNVLDRIKQRSAPLPPEQANDWDWFRKKWDKSRVELLPKERRLVWGHTFKNIAISLLTKIQNGEHDTLSRWMAQECRDYLCMPALRC